MTTETPYGLDNPAPGTRLWRLREHPETLTLEDAVRVAQDLDAARAESFAAGRAAARGPGSIFELRLAVLRAVIDVPFPADVEERPIRAYRAAIFTAVHLGVDAWFAHPVEAEEKPDAA